MPLSKNLEYQKTSFLSKSNSAFIEKMYLRFIENDPSLPESWKKYFKSLDEDLVSVAKELEGPTWKINKEKIDINLLKSKKELNQLENNFNNKEDDEKLKKDSIKAIALIRAYRIRGHLIANIDPLGMMDRKYLHELHPADHGFKKEFD